MIASYPGNKQLCFLFILIVAATSGCKKDNTSDPAAEKSYPWKFSIINVSTGDTLLSQELFYDDLKRPSSSISKSGNSLIPGIYSEYDTTFTFYNGNDSLPLRDITTGIIDNVDRVKYEGFYFYDNLKRLIRDSGTITNSPNLTPDVFNIQTYSYTSTNFFSKSRQIIGITSPTIYTTYDTATINAAGNLISDSKSVYDDMGNLTRKLYTTVTPSNFAIPVDQSLLSGAYSFLDYITSPVYIQPLPSKNFAATLNQDVVYDENGDTDFFHTTISYTFLPNGNVSEMDVMINSHDPKHYKYTYVYKTL